MRIEVPDGVRVARVELEELPRGWTKAPEHPRCVELGDAWVAEGRTLALAVPSAIVPEERNFLLNPVHADAKRMTIASSRSFA